MDTPEHPKLLWWFDDLLTRAVRDDAIRVELEMTSYTNGQLIGRVVTASGEGTWQTCRATRPHVEFRQLLSQADVYSVDDIAMGPMAKPLTRPAGNATVKVYLLNCPGLASNGGPRLLAIPRTV